MKLIKKLLYGIFGLLSLVSLFIILCAFWPQLADKTSDFLYRNLRDGKGTVGEKTAMDDAAAENDGAESDGFHGGTDGKDGWNGNGGPTENMNGMKSDGGVEGTGRMPMENLSDYVPPERTAVDAPERVAGRSGYVPVQDDVEQIDEEEAKAIEKRYTYGETGEGLDFDTEYYPYYGMLSEKERSLYRQIYANSIALNRIFNPIASVSQGELRNTFIAVFNDHPELFWLESAYRGKFARSGECAEIALQFNYLVDDLNGAKKEFNAVTEEILSKAQGLESDYEAEIYVHNALLDRMEYDLRAPLNQSAYSGLVNGRTVCAGYARSFQYLMTELGIPCYYCTGYAGENHAWNIIRLEDEYYNADATWDDTEPNTYDYLNKTDHDFASTHRREDLSVYLPMCNGTKYGNLETANAEDALVDDRKSLEEVGFLEEDVLYGMREYYEDCYNRLIEAGGSAQFENIVDSEELWLRCYRAYEDDSYSAGYMNKVLEELQADGCEVDIEAESLRDGRVLLHHRIRFF